MALLIGANGRLDSPSKGDAWRSEGAAARGACAPATGSAAAILVHVGKASVQGKDLWRGNSPELVAQGWFRTVAELVDQIQSKFWVDPPRQTGIPNDVQAIFLVVALWSQRQHTEMVRAHLRSKGDLKDIMKAVDTLLPDLQSMRDTIDHLDEYYFGAGRRQRELDEDPQLLAPVLAVRGPAPGEASTAEDFHVCMISSMGVWEFSLQNAVRCSQAMFVAVHNEHHRCRRCYDLTSHRCTICRPLTEQELDAAFGLGPGSVPRNSSANDGELGAEA